MIYQTKQRGFDEFTILLRMNLVLRMWIGGYFINSLKYHSLFGEDLPSFIIFEN